jgi:spore maturation protein CgeB
LNCWMGCDTCYHGGYQGQEKSWGLAERCYGIQACGGFLLSDHRRHAEVDFLIGKEWIEFVDLDDCVDKIRHYIGHFDDARDVAEAAYRRVMKDHTYSNRAQTLLEAADQWRERGKNRRLFSVSIGQ